MLAEVVAIIEGKESVYSLGLLHVEYRHHYDQAVNIVKSNGYAILHEGKYVIRFRQEVWSRRVR